MNFRFIANDRLSSTLAIFFVALLALLLYVPFLHAEIVFDDHGLFSNLVIYEFAVRPIDLRARTFPYFTLGLIQVLCQSLAANRIFSLLLHLACAGILFSLLREFLTVSFKHSDLHIDRKNGKWLYFLSFLIALGFAIHPIAVYGAAYMAQRTGLFATLFALLSIWFYRRSFAENRTADVITAALFYSFAVFSKEHAIMLPLAALPLAGLYEGGWHAHFKRMALYLVLCIPAALTVLLATKHVVASSYEPDVAVMLTQMQGITAMTQPGGEWLVSFILQAGFFFDYLAYWLVPDVRFLSADMRFDFVQMWSSWWVFPKAFLFFLSPLLALYFLRKKGMVALFCCGFLYSWFLFMTELVAVRFQEPFVLYRSYLWAPGYAMMLAAVCARIPQRWLIVGAVPLLVICFMLARDRLTSLSTEANVWKDAAAKLASPNLMGSDRIFYNRGMAYLREKKYEEAAADFSHTIQLNPKVAQAYYNRALAYYALEQYTDAMTDLDRALSLNAKDASAYYVRGLILERRVCIEAARQAFAASMRLGNQVAKLKLDGLEKKNGTEQGMDKPKSDVCPAS